MPWEGLFKSCEIRTSMSITIRVEALKQKGSSVIVYINALKSTIRMLRGGYEKS